MKTRTMAHPIGETLSVLIGVLIAVGCGDQVSYEPAANPDSPGMNPAGNAASPASDTAATLKTVSPEEALAILENPPAGLVVLDVRTAAEFEAGHLEGATQLDFYGENFDSEIGALDKNVPYLLYCQSGGRSASTLNTMRGLGFRLVYEIDGGYGAWVASGHPTVD